MKKNKKVFLIFGFGFIIFLLWISYDISSRTTFPGRDRIDTEEPAGSPAVSPDSIMILENS